MENSSFIYCCHSAHLRSRIHESLLNCHNHIQAITHYHHVLICHLSTVLKCALYFLPIFFVYYLYMPAFINTNWVLDVQRTKWSRSGQIWTSYDNAVRSQSDKIDGSGAIRNNSTEEVTFKQSIGISRQKRESFQAEGIVGRKTQHHYRARTPRRVNLLAWLENEFCGTPVGQKILGNKAGKT
jgi:hypothetical protein